MAIMTRQVLSALSYFIQLLVAKSCLAITSEVAKMTLFVNVARKHYNC